MTQMDAAFHSFAYPQMNSILVPGTKVTIKGLTSDRGSTLNGKTGVVKKFIMSKMRVCVGVKDKDQQQQQGGEGEKEYLLKRENLMTRDKFNLAVTELLINDHIAVLAGYQLQNDGVTQDVCAMLYGKYKTDPINRSSFVIFVQTSHFILFPPPPSGVKIIDGPDGNRKTYLAYSREAYMQGMSDIGLPDGCAEPFFNSMPGGATFSALQMGPRGPFLKS